MPDSLMNLKILLPFQIFAQKTGVLRIVVETEQGSFGLLPQRLDCIAALCPGILTYETEAEGEVYVAVDEGTLIKTERQVLVSVHNAIGGKDLDTLYESVQNEFLTTSEQERNARVVLGKLESAFVRRFVEISHG
ncbi:F0F1 ATP synthase subunit epsilon [Legionella sp. PATHC038]|uniref:F0F1 ATP synthase subunit epsilon n=1 Tax=Legionella sheltonii TaxID=2992041 RepID=UPI002244425F|nr:F0F1 ATP synthase subunit epsilon [Legionella sp. PATHC038]MCW8399444.1 F0F1 ATP synthase subunit epsilon [Legionella sp. PATHC038]